MIGVGRHLHGELAARGERRPTTGRARSAWSGTHCRLALASTRSWSPRPRPLGDVAAGEAQPVVGRRRPVARPSEHGVGRVDADHLVDAEPLGDGERQLPRAAAEVDAAPEARSPPGALDAAPTRSQNGCDRSRGELRVLAGIPRVPRRRRVPRSPLAATIARTMDRLRRPSRSGTCSRDVSRPPSSGPSRNAIRTSCRSSAVDRALDLELELDVLLAGVLEVLELDDVHLLEAVAQPAVVAIEQAELLAVGHDLGEQHRLEEVARRVAAAPAERRRGG